jgi:hypothetical protein
MWNTSAWLGHKWHNNARNYEINPGLLTKLQRNVMIKYACAVLLLITGRIGIPKLRSYSWALTFVGAGLFCIRYFIWSLSINRLQSCIALCIDFWNLYVGSFYDKANVFTGAFKKLIRNHFTSHNIFYFTIVLTIQQTSFY